MLLSVALCTYNGELFIAEQLLSIVSQQLPVHEIIVCDDGSSDQTYEVVQAFAGAHTEFRWILHQNDNRLGVVRNFQQAIRLCSGDLVFLSDQDDVWLPTKTLSIVDYFNAHPDKEVVFTDASIIDAQGTVFLQRSLLQIVGLESQRQYFEMGLHYEIFNGANKATGATMALRSQFVARCIDELRDDIIPLHDEQFAAEAIARQSLGCLFEPCMYYRLHGHNQMGLDLHSLPDAVYRRYLCSPILLQSLYDHPKYGFRRAFLQLRHRRVQSFWGRCSLVLQYHNYVRCYRQAAVRFLWTDLTYGLFYIMQHHSLPE